MSLESRCVNGSGHHIIFHIYGLPHCPRNRSHKIKKKGHTAFLGKTEAAEQYEKALLFHLQKYKTMAELFAKNFNRKTDHLVATWEFSSPDTNTKEGWLSQTGTDLDAHKVCQDTIMKFVGIDDAFIKKDIREKFQGDFRVSLELVIRENNGAHYL